jgi:NADPH-dependent curcumin reductase CurA
MSATNRQFRLAARPVGLSKRSDWNQTTVVVAEPAAGQVLVKVLQLSLDPAMRGWMNEGRSYIPPVGIGEVMRAGGAGKVIASKNPQFAVGDHVSGMMGVQDYRMSDGKDIVKIDLRLGTLPQWLNALGMPGMTGYFGLLEVGQARAGDTVVVSGAAGAVGQTVGQVAKIKGCRAVGNVGGEILDAVLTRINRGARVVICGAISQYNNTEPVKGPSNYLSLLVNRARMQGMVVFDYADRYALAVKDIAQWMREGKFVSREDMVAGIENFPEALNKLFSGENFGKLVLKVADG